MKNIRTLGLPEDTPTENLGAKIRDLMRDLEMELGETMNSIDSVMRLGKPTKNDNQKPRQVLLTFKSIESRHRFIRNCMKLKGKRRGFAILED